MALSETITNLGAAIINLVNAKVSNAISVNNTEIEGVLSDLQAQIDDLPEGEHSVDKNQITNCILEIPQRIVDLRMQSGGTYTQIVASTKNTFIYPNGFEEDGVTPHFDYVQFEEEVNSGTGGPSGTNSGNILLMPVKTVPPDKFPTSGRLWYYLIGKNIFSGSEAPSTSSPYLNILWYDTTANKIKHSLDGGETWETDEEICLPCAVCSSDSTGFTSINQIFNGIGFMGTGLWIDKGVKMLMSDGLNDDGTYKNEEYTTDRVYFAPESVGITSNKDYIVYFYKPDQNFGDDVYPISRAAIYYEQETEPPQPTTSAICIWKNPATNKNYLMRKVSNINEWTEIKACVDITKISGSDDGHVTALANTRAFQSTNAKDIDGMWFFTPQSITSNTIITAGNSKSFDLSDYLPKDNYIYEVLMTAQTIKKSNNYSSLYGSSDLTNSLFSYCFTMNNTNISSASGNQSFSGATNVVVIGTKRNVTMYNSSAVDITLQEFNVHGYRKVR